MPKPILGVLGAATLVAVAVISVHTSPVTQTPARIESPSTQVVERASATTQAVAQAGRQIRVTVPRRAVAGERFKVRGNVGVARRGRAVVLLTKTPVGYKRVARTRTDARGSFQFNIEAPQRVGQSRWRVSAQRFGRHRAQSAAFTVEVTTRTQTPTGTPTAAGSTSDWTYISADKSMRWDPCTPITWYYSPAQQAYPSAEQDVAQAIAMLAARTGHTFTRIPNKDQAALDIAWATPAEVPMLRGSTVGVGGPSYQSIDPDQNHGTQAAIISGSVTFDATETAHAGFDNAAGWTWGQVMLHEIMHAMGLGHAHGDRQVMFPMASIRNQRFGAGDLSGLRAVGAEKGCLTTGTGLTPAALRTVHVAE